MGYLGNQPTSSSYPVDYFSGTGAQTDFTMSESPVSVGAILVSVSGVVEKPTAYTISGTTLSFTAAPASGTDNIEVRHLGIRTEVKQPAAASVGDTELEPSDIITRARMQTAAGLVASDKRQTVLTGKVDANGDPNFISIGTGLACDLDATSNPLVASMAGGFDDKGPVEYVQEELTDIASAWSGLTANTTNYLYMDRNSGTGAITYGAVDNLRPVYGHSFQKARGSGRSYVAFDGADTSTTFTDANPDNTFTAVDNAQLDTAQKKFGTASLLLDGITDKVTSDLNIRPGENDGGFLLDIHARPNVDGTDMCIFDTENLYRLRLERNSTNNLNLLLSSTGSGWNITGGTTGTASIVAGSWYHIRLQWDKAIYKVYVDGVEDISFTSSSGFVADNTLRIGSRSDGNVRWTGWFDELVYETRPITHGAFSAPTAARGSLGSEGEHWFDMQTFKMTELISGTWTDRQRVFLGECVTDGSSVTSVITYALRGEYESNLQVIAASTDYSLAHNLGMVPKDYAVDVVNVLQEEGWVVDDIIRNHNFDDGTNNGAWGIVVNRQNVELVSGATLYFAGKTTNDSAAMTFANWKALYKVKRGW